MNDEELAKAKAEVIADQLAPAFERVFRLGFKAGREFFLITEDEAARQFTETYLAGKK
jgi:hypothetical protein